MADCKATQSGIGAQHRHQCIKPEHPGLGETPDDWHECACRFRWTEERELNDGKQVGQVIRMPSDQLEQVAPSGRRLHDGPDAPRPVTAPRATGGPIGTGDYTYHDGTGRQYRINRVSSIQFAPGHVVFLRDGGVVFAVENARVHELEPVDVTNQKHVSAEPKGR